MTNQKFIQGIVQELNTYLSRHTLVFMQSLTSLLLTNKFIKGKNKCPSQR